jgi:hypothetical protein
MNNWFRVLWKLDDPKLVEINGIDYTLYLIFLRYSAIFFLFLTVFNGVMMLPIYVSGNPTKDVISMEKITVLNIQESPKKIIATYFMTLMVVSCALMVTL